MRPVLTVRDPGIERLISSIPVQPDNTDELRGWAQAITAAASAWEVRRAKDNAAARNQLRGRKP